MDSAAELLQRGDVKGWNSRPSKKGTDLVGLRLHGIKLNGVRLDGANLAGAEFIGCDLKGASFNAANVTNANFIKSALHEAKFQNAMAAGARFDRISMPRVDFGGAGLQGASLIGVWGEKCDFVGADLSNAVLQAARLSFSKFANAIMRRSDLRLADLRCCDLAGTDLSEAMLGGAALDRATFDGAILSGTGYSLFKPTMARPKPGSSRVPSEDDHWDAIFRDAERRAFYAGKALVMARGVSCDLDRGREYQDKYLEEIVRSGGLLSITAEPFPYVEVESPIATTFANPTGVTQGFSLYLFEQCSFEQSLSLVELFSFTPRRTEKGRVIPFGSREIDWANDEVRERTLKSVFQLLRALRQQHQIVISEYLEGVIQVQKIDADDGSWSDAVKHVLEFHRNVLMSRFGKEELAEYRRYFVKNRTFFLG